MSFFSRNATNQQTHSTTKPSGLSNAADYSTTVNKFGKEILTLIYIDIDGLEKSSSNSIICNSGSPNSDVYIYKN